MSNKFFSNNYDSDSSESESESEVVTNSNKKNKTESDNASDIDSDIGSESDASESENANSNNILQDMTNLITLRYIKDGKAARTYIYGLELFVTTPEEVIKIAKEIQKKLSTGYFNQNNSHGYNGDHRLKIEKLLHTQYNIPKNKIKVC